ncbi:hypothetical protein LO80_06430 [Candidatus Francisella endociliophora]|uniref:Thioredoxin-like fold domain-containing protein n=1 Tax=Candidatus Francisella endociliophora TaxID=653937 RepID=A0A097EPY9_9GAMM|nr:hypothetical protein [Francisella sp. FSC1006]AIT09633.1 hypothetical protein LO80_06430 [Francisella sp. FSC1006]
MIKKTIISLGIAFSAITLNYALPQHAEGEQVCDMHAFTQYNKYLAFFNKHLILSENTSKINYGSNDAKYKILQFCDFESKSCLANYKTLQHVAKQHNDVSINLLYYSNDDHSISENVYKASLTVYLAKGQTAYREFINKVSKAPIKTDSELATLLKSFNISDEDMKKYTPEVSNIVKHSKEMAKELKISHIPAVFIMPKKDISEKNIYYSEFEDVPQYIIERALNHLDHL